MSVKEKEKSEILEGVFQAIKKFLKVIRAFLIRLIRKKGVLPYLFGILSTGLVILLFSVFFGSTHSAPAIISTSTLEKIVKISDLSTFEAVYNGIASVPNPKEEGAISYYVSYDGRVKAGINVEDISIDVNKDDKIITVTLPEIKITDVSVDITSLDYLFCDDKANTYSVSEEAYRKCIDDATNKSSQTAILYELAEENAKNFIHALLSPFVMFFDSEYQIQICGQGEA